VGVGGGLAEDFGQGVGIETSFGKGGRDDVFELPKDVFGGGGVEGLRAVVAHGL
jgi:hypothetical protein